MNKKENRIAVRQAAEKAVIRDEQNRRIQFAATNPIKEVLKNLHTTLRGLDAEAVFVDEDKNVYVTSGLMDKFELMKDGYIVNEL